MTTQHNHNPKTTIQLSNQAAWQCHHHCLTENATAPQSDVWATGAEPGQAEDSLHHRPKEYHAVMTHTIISPATATTLLTHFRCNSSQQQDQAIRSSSKLTTTSSSWCTGQQGLVWLTQHGIPSAQTYTIDACLHFTGHSRKQTSPLRL